MTGRGIVIGLAVSCGDTLCADWVTQDRLAAVSAVPHAARITLFPAGSLSIGAEGTVSVDSIRAFHANDRALVQARRISTTDHPCYGGPESSKTEDAELRVSADSILRTLRIEDWHESPDGDPRKMERKMRTETLRLVYDPRLEKFVVRRSSVTR